MLETDSLGAQDQDQPASEMHVDSIGCDVENDRCDQCKKVVQGKVVTCRHCKRERFCTRCLEDWYIFLCLSFILFSSLSYLSCLLNIYVLFSWGENWGFFMILDKAIVKITGLDFER